MLSTATPSFSLLIPTEFTDKQITTHRIKCLGEVSEAIYLGFSLFLLFDTVSLSHEAEGNDLVHCFLSKMLSHLSFTTGSLNPIRSI